MTYGMGMTNSKTIQLLADRIVLSAALARRMGQIEAHQASLVPLAHALVSEAHISLQSAKRAIVASRGRYAGAL